MFLRIGSSVKRIPKKWPEFRIWSDVFSQLIVQTWGRMISMFMGCMHPGFKSGGKKMRNSLLLCSIASDLLTGSFEPSILRIIWKDSEICQNYMSRSCEILKNMKISWLLSNDKAVYAIFSTWGSPRNHRKMLYRKMLQDAISLLAKDGCAKLTPGVDCQAPKVSSRNVHSFQHECWKSNYVVKECCRDMIGERMACNDKWRYRPILKNGIPSLQGQYIKNPELIISPGITCGPQSNSMHVPIQPSNLMGTPCRTRRPGENTKKKEPFLQLEWELHGLKDWSFSCDSAVRWRECRRNDMEMDHLLEGRNIALFLDTKVFTVGLSKVSPGNMFLFFFKGFTLS